MPALSRGERVSRCIGTGDESVDRSWLRLHRTALRNCFPPSAYCHLPTIDCLLRLLLPLSAYCLLPTATCLLPTAFCFLPTAFCLLPSRQGAGLHGAGGIDGVGAFVNVANDAVPIDDEGNAIGKEAGEAEHSVRLGHFLFRVTEQREGSAGFLGKFAVPLLAVEADPQHLRARRFEFGDITLIRLDLLRSTGCGGANVKRQDDGFLAAEVREFDDSAVLIRQRKVRGAVANLQCRRCSK